MVSIFPIGPIQKDRLVGADHFETMKNAYSIILLLCLVMTCGCGISNSKYMTDVRLDKGMIVILPGIEGESPYNHNIRRGLISAGLPSAIPIYNWGAPLPGIGMVINQTNFIGNRLAGVRIAKMITDYQDEHPDQPVFVIGHSGGGGVAVFTAEAMPEGRQLDGLILLSASISEGYDLTKALSRCKSGIVNFYHTGDVGMLAVGTTLMGNVDGVHGPSAGLGGFVKANSSDTASKRDAYARLFQVRVQGGHDPHFAATDPKFVRRQVAPWISSSIWPAGLKASAARIVYFQPAGPKDLAPRPVN